MAYTETESERSRLGGPIEGPVPRVAPSEAVRRHPMLVLLPVLMCLGLAVAAATLKNPTYTAESRLIVSGLDLTAPGALGGYSEASAALASTFSRSIEAEEIVDPVARDLDLSTVDVRQRVKAAPVPQSPVFRVSATGPTAEDAVRLSNAMATSLREYTNRAADTDPAQDRTLRQYRRATLEAEQLRSKHQELRRRLGGNPSAGGRNRLASVKSQLDEAELRVDSLQLTYKATQQGQGRSGQADILAAADTAQSDSSSFLQIALLAGLVVGLTLGVAAATLLANRNVRRRYWARVRADSDAGLTRP